MRTLSRLALLPLEPRDEGPDSAYDQARRGLLRYDQLLRRSEDRVARLCEQLRRRHAQAELIAATLPALVLPLRGPAGGITGGRIVVDNHRAAAVELRVRPGLFEARARAATARPRLHASVRPAVLTPSASASVSLWIDLEGTPFAAGDAVDGDIELLVEDQVALRISVELSLY